MTGFAKILLSEEGSERYGVLLPIPGQGLKCILHLAAERNLVEIAEAFLEIYPNGVYLTTDKDKLPLEFALTKRNDTIASFLASKMFHERYLLHFK